MTEAEQIAELKQQLQLQQEQINGLKASGSQRLEDKKGRGMKVWQWLVLLAVILLVAVITVPPSIVSWIVFFEHGL